MTRKAARGGDASEGLAELERRLGHTFGNPELARQALTHRSAGTPHNERLEFLGDSLLNCAVAALLYARFPRLPEGDLSRLRAALVNQASLSSIASELGLGERLHLGEGEMKSGGFRRPSILADGLEAILGAVYLDAGFDPMLGCVERLMGDRLEDRAGLPVDKDPKTALQELLQGRKLQLPRYSVQRTEGEAHEQTFTVECRVDDLGVAASGQGASRRAAEQAAAELVLAQVEKKPAPGVRMKAKPGFRTGTVAVVGRPNVGKSTLLNKFVGAHVAITSRKAQTTRHRILGIHTDTRAQYIFVDTPGYQTQHQNALNRGMNRTVGQVANEVDVIVMVIEAHHWDERDTPLLELLPAGTPVILALNKLDKMGDKSKLAATLTDAATRRDFAAFVPVSAQKGTQLRALLEEIRQRLPEQAPVYEEDDITDRPERFLAAELVRERIFRLLGDELPYSIAVVVDHFETEGNLRRIAATIFVDKTSHKAIVIGEKGATLKRIGTEARHAMEALFGSKVYLETHVKVKSGWADNEAALRQLGYR